MRVFGALFKTGVLFLITCNANLKTMFIGSGILYLLRDEILYF